VLEEQGSEALERATAGNYAGTEHVEGLRQEEKEKERSGPAKARRAMEFEENFTTDFFEIASERKLKKDPISYSPVL